MRLPWRCVQPRGFRLQHVLRRGLCSTEAAGPLQFRSARKILVVSKTTRYENELASLARKHCAVQAPALLRAQARQQRSDPEWLRAAHDAHEASVASLCEGLQRLPWKPDVQVVKCYGGLRRSHIVNADFVFSLGGDGTLVRTASFVQGFEAPLICGINTNPSRSHGFLCVNHAQKDDREACMSDPEVVDQFLRRLASPEVQYITRNRIRITVSPPSGVQPTSQRTMLALNDVLVAEHEAQKASYYEMSFLDSNEQKVVEKHKSSGLLVTTGTGSTAWSKSISALQPAMVRRVLELAGSDLTSDPVLHERVADAYNSRLSFSPDAHTMRFVVREPIINGVFACNHSAGFADAICVHARSEDLRISLDGQLMAPLPLSHLAHLSMHSEDALRVVDSV